MATNKTGGGVGTTRTRSGHLVIKGSAKGAPSAKQTAPLFLGGKDTVQDYLKSIGQYDLLSREQEQALGMAMEAGAEATARLNSEASLTSYERRKLRVAVEKGHQAKNQFVEANLRLVVSEAKRFARQGLQLEDIIQEGSIGLIRAVEKYDWRTGYKLSTYATAWIRQAIRRGIAGSARPIRLPAHAVEAHYSVLEAKRELREQENKREEDISPEDVARVSHLPLEKVKEVFAYPANPQSLSIMLDAEGSSTELQDILPTKNAVEPERAAVDSLEAADLRRLMETVLDERERSVLCMRFGLGYGGNASAESATLEDVGKHHGCTRERARQIEVRALMKLRLAQQAGNVLDQPPPSSALRESVI